MHLSPDIIARINQLKLQTKKLLMSHQVGEQRSRTKGFGMEFDQLREYQLGDDIRFIDWKSTARMGTVLVKQFTHEYTQTILLCIDVSASTRFGKSGIKSRLMQEIATVLALAAENNRARVGLILFAEDIIRYIPPKKSARHMQLVISHLWELPKEQKKTNINTLLQFVASLNRKDAMVFILSDFIDQGFEQSLAMVHKKLDLIGIRCLDPLEDNLNLGCFINLSDSEDDTNYMIDSRGNNYSDLTFLLRQRLKNQEMVMKKHAIDLLTFWTGKAYITSLVSFFNTRVRR